MSLYVALLLLGQVANVGDPPVPTINSSANSSASETVPSARFAPTPVTVDSHSEGPPSEGPPSEGPPSEGPSKPLPQALTARRSPRGSITAAPPASLRAPVAAQPMTNFEPQVGLAPVSGNPTAGNPTAGNSQILQVAATMMEEILVLGEESQRSMRRVRLVEALARLGDPGLQSAAIRSYWELAQSIANARYAGDKVRVLSELALPASAMEGAVLKEAQAAAEAEDSASQDTLLAAQYGLLRVTGLPIDDALPWPTDAPLVASYRTQFETIFANRPAPLPVRQIHHSLPGKLLLIEKRVSAVAAAESTLDAVQESYNGNRASLDQILLAIERLDKSRRAFLAAIVDYNYQIAEYSLAVVGTGVGPEMLVTTLIKSAPANTALVASPQRAVRQAAAVVPAQ